MKTAELSYPLAVVLGMSPTGLFVARSLGRRGVPVIGVDRDFWSVGRFSKYVRFLHVENEGALYKAMVRVASSEDQKPILFCADDYHLHFLAKYAQALSEYYVIPRSYNKATIEMFLDKRKFYMMCMKYSIELPSTYFPSDLGEVKSISREISYPCVIKPVFSYLWRKKLRGKKMVEVNSPDELVRQYMALSSFNKDLIIQEVVPGGDELIYVFGGYFDRNSEPLAMFTGRKLRQFPPKFGSASLVESLWCQEIAEKSVALLKKVGFHGVCGTEFKLDPRSGTFKMMEINIRPTLWFSITEASGVDIIYVAYRDLAGFPVENSLSQRDYVRWVYSLRDFVSAIYYISRGELSFKKWIRSLKGIKAHAIYAKDDLYPVILMPICLASEFLSHFVLGG